MVRRRRIAGACFALALIGVRADAADAQLGGEKLVVIVRHAEKEAGDDPALSDAGETRARALAHLLSRWRVEAIYTSQYLRTRSTARPFADAAGIDPVTVDAGDLTELVTRIREGDARTVLVVGHSNTVPKIAEALGAEHVQPIPEEGYDDLLIVRLMSDGTARLLHLKYGTPTPY